MRLAYKNSNVVLKLDCSSANRAEDRPRLVKGALGKRRRRLEKQSAPQRAEDGGKAFNDVAGEHRIFGEVVCSDSSGLAVQQDPERRRRRETSP